MNARLTVDRSRLPVPGSPPPFRFPVIDRSTLSNGLRVWSVPHTSIPVATVMLLIRRGAADDPAGREGLAAITTDMLDEGTGAMSSIEIHEALARVGAQLDSDIGPDATLLTVTVLSRFLKPALSLLADIVVRPSLRDEDFERVRQLRLHRLVQLRDMPGAVADRAFMRLIYGQHPYGHTPLGNEQSLSALTIDDVRRFHLENIRPGDATLVIAGDCTHDEVSAEELSLGVAALTRGYARNFETAEQLARAVTQLALYDLPDSYFDEFVSRVEHLTVGDVTRVTQQYLDPSRLTTLVVGDYGVVSRDLPRLNLGVPSILASDTF